VQLDLGGITKGWCADTATRRLAEYGPALVDAGGDIASSGLGANGARVPIGVAHPLCSDTLLAMLAVGKCGVATSGKDQRRWHFAGHAQHHIINPATGQPAHTNVLSATVIAPDTITAEIAAKCAFILGSAVGLDWLEQRPEIAGLLVLDTGELLASSRWQPHLLAEQS